MLASTILYSNVVFVFLISHERQHGFSRVKVDSMKAEMKKVFEKMVKKRRLIRTGWSLLVLTKHCTIPDCETNNVLLVHGCQFYIFSMRLIFFKKKIKVYC